MLYNNLELVKHIRDESAFILQYTKGKNHDEIVQDEVLSRAIIRSLQIIGEAARKIDNDFKASHPEIDWKKMSGTRDRLIHDYLGVDYDIVWSIITEKLPLLQQHSAEILKNR